jgi:STE24 endopeptidase
MTAARGTRKFTAYKAYKADPKDWYSEEEISKSEEYNKPLRAVGRTVKVIDFVIVLAIIGFNVVPKLLDAFNIDNWVIGVLLATAVVTLADQITGIPVSRWRELNYDKRWGFSNQTNKQWWTDLLKGIPLGIVISTALFLPIWWLIRTNDLWWMWGGLVLVAFVIVFATLYPVAIAPIFNKYTPLEDGPLREAVFETARKVGADISDVLVEDSSKRDSRGNAYVAGLGKTRRVVIFDTMLGESHDKLMSVVAHELGHWKLRHILKRIPLVGVLGFMNFVLLKFLMESEAVQDFAGAESIGDPAMFPVFYVAFPLVGVLTGLISSWLSRVHEREADLFSMKALGNGQSLADGFAMMSRKYLMDVTPTTWNRLTRSHPPFAERMAMCTHWHEAHVGAAKSRQ